MHCFSEFFSLKAREAYYTQELYKKKLISNHMPTHTRNEMTERKL